MDSSHSRRTTARTPEWTSNGGSTLTDVAAMAENPDMQPSEIGDLYRDGKLVGRLNPAWVAVLMGYPPTWGIVTASPELYGVPAWNAAASYAGGSEWPAPPGQPQRAWEPPRLVPDIVAEGRRALAAFGNAWVPQAAYVAWRHAITMLVGHDA